MVETAVVIGDGPSAEGKGWGPLIDAQDRVIRMWNHEWQVTADYGTRYDHGLVTLPGDARQSLRKPRISWFFYSNRDCVAFINRRPVVPLYFNAWVDRALAMGAAPAVTRKPLKLTRGFAAAAGALETLKPKRLTVVGMDMLMAGATVSPRYGPAATAYRKVVWSGISLEEVPPGSPREGPHDYAIEKQLFAALAAEAGTEISWGF